MRFLNLKKCAVLLGVLCMGFAAQAATVPVRSMLGKYGFDWLNPELAQCRRIQEKCLTKIKSCRPADTASFSGAKGHFVCKVKDGELLVYESKERCLEELETMQANAP